MRKVCGRSHCTHARQGQCVRRCSSAVQTLRREVAPLPSVLPHPRPLLLRAARQKTFRRAVPLFLSPLPSRDLPPAASRFSQNSLHRSHRAVFSTRTTAARRKSGGRTRRLSAPTPLRLPRCHRPSSLGSIAFSPPETAACCADCRHDKLPRWWYPKPLSPRPSAARGGGGGLRSVPFPQAGGAVRRAEGDQRASRTERGTARMRAREVDATCLGAVCLSREVVALGFTDTPI